MQIIFHCLMMTLMIFISLSCGSSRHIPTLLEKIQFADRTHAVRIAVFEINDNLEQAPLSHLIKQGISRLNPSDYLIFQPTSNQYPLSKNCALQCIFEFAQKHDIKELIIINQFHLNRYRFTSNTQAKQKPYYEFIAKSEISSTSIDTDRGKIQAKVLGLFLKDHPELKAKINRLERNIYFEKMFIDELDSANLQKLPKQPDLKLKSNPQVLSEALEGIGQFASLKTLNLDLLELYEQSINEEKNPSILPLKKYENWQKLKSINTYPQITTIINSKLAHWAYEEALWFDADLTTIKQKLKKWESFKQQYPQDARLGNVQKRIDELNDYLNQTDVQQQADLKFYNELLAWDQKRSQLRENGYKKILQLRSTPNISQEELLDWINAWIESNGVHPLINPDLQKLDLQSRALDLQSNIQEMKKRQLPYDLVELNERTRWIKMFPYEFWDQHGVEILKTIVQAMDPTNPQEVTFDVHGITMVKISGGSFEMKINLSENPQALRLPVQSATVHLKSFYISKHEVTVAQYQKCIDAKVCLAPTNEYLCNLSLSKELDPKKYQDHPMNCITWENARQFAKWMGGDLPSESQWVYVAQSQGQDLVYPWGNAPDPNCDLANTNYYDCSQYRHTSAVCAHPLGNSQQGLCDLIGNVREFVLDEVDEYEWSIPKNILENALKNHVLKIPRDGKPLCETPTCTTPEKAHITRGGDRFAHFNEECVSHETFHIAKNKEQSDLHLEGFRIVRMNHLDDLH
jgi:formylglycine-generating enzyme required for sulfatase activity